MADIFISYSREDLERVRPIVRHIQNAGWSVFWDRTIPAGMTWRQYIGNALDDAKCVVVLWSKHSVESKFVQEEADDGNEREILVPILIDDVKPPLGLRSIQHEDLRNWGDDPEHKRAKTLLVALERVTGKLPKKVPPSDNLDTELDLQTAVDEEELEFDIANDGDAESSEILNTTKSEDLVLDIQKYEKTTPPEVELGEGLESEITSEDASSLDDRSAEPANKVEASLLDAKEENLIEAEKLLPKRKPKGRGKKRALSISVTVIMILFFLVGSGYLVLQFPETLMQSISRWKKDDTKRPDLLSTHSINSKFVENKIAGQLFVIEGIVRNNFPSPISFIKVVGKIYGNDKQMLKYAEVYCGNVLTTKELKNLTLSNIHAWLKNREGDNDRNKIILPGGEIPFMVVFGELPMNKLEEFTIEVSDWVNKK